MAVSPELMTELLELPEPERVDLAWRLLDNLREDSSRDALDDEDRAQLHEALERSEDDRRAGRTRPASEMLADLARRR